MDGVSLLLMIEFLTPDSDGRWPARCTAAIAVVMTAAMVCYPIGYDQAVFQVGGRMILHGSIPWRDFIDTKPPLIFYIYSAASVLFGDHAWSIRAFDAIYQILCAWYFMRIVRRSPGPNVALLSAALLLMMTAGLGFWHTAQVESFALLPSLVLADATLRAPLAPTKRAVWLGMIAGFAAMLLVLLKFTLVLGAVAAFVWLARNRQSSSSAKRNFLTSFVASFILLCGLLVAALALTSGLSRWVEVIGWLSHYSAIGQAGEPQWQRCLIDFPRWLVSSASPTLFVAAIGAIFYVRKRGAWDERPLIGLFLITWIFHLAGILLEGKMFEYQYARGLWVFAPIAAIGLTLVAQQSRKLWLQSTHRVRMVLLLGLAGVAAVLCSPIVRIYTQTLPWTVLALKHQEAGTEVHRRIKDYYADEQEATGRYLNSRMAKDDQLFFWGNDVAIYLYADKLPTTLCLTATPLRTEWTPSAWKREMLRQLSLSNPKYFVTQFGDAKPYITGSNLDSYSSLLTWTELSDYLITNFRLDTTIGHYLIYSRKG